MSADWAYIPASDAPDAPYYYANLAIGETQWERPVTLNHALNSEASSSSSSSSPGKRAPVKVQKAAKVVAADGQVGRIHGQDARPPVLLGRRVDLNGLGGSRTPSA